MVRTRVGYTGGDERNPTYHDLGGHTEAIQIDYDSSRISYADLLEVFWGAHAPCRRSFSTQYKAAVFTHDDAQRQAAEETAAKIALERGELVRTEIVPLKTFWRAEPYHQKYKLRYARRFAEELERIYPEPERFTDSTVATRLNAWLSGHGSKAELERHVDELGLSAAAKEDLLARTRRL